MKSFSIFLTLIAMSASANAAILVFNDTFDYDGIPNPQTNVNDEQVTRQAAGTTTSTYAEQLGGAGIRDAMLTVANGQDQMRFQTTNQASGGSQTAMDLNTNFATQLAGNYYKINLTDLALIRGNADVTDLWFSISVGDTATSITGPNNTTADVGLIIRPSATIASNMWQDNNNLGVQAATGLTLGYTFATRFAIAELHVDETGVQDVAWSYFRDMNGNEFTTTPVNINFENLTNRYIELRTHQGSTGSNGTDVSAYINSLSINVIPEPTSALLGGLGLLTLIRRRR